MRWALPIFVVVLGFGLTVSFQNCGSSTEESAGSEQLPSQIECEPTGNGTQTASWGLTGVFDGKVPATSPNKGKIYGWVFDTDNKSGPVSVQVFADGTYLTTLTANEPRGDVNAAFSIPGNHGFSVNFRSIGLTSGNHLISIKAVDPETCNAIDLQHSPGQVNFDTD